jgi:integrase
MQNLRRRPSGVYVARLTVPARLRALVGSTELIASTGSRSLTIAKLVASEILAGWRRQLFDLDRLALCQSSMTPESLIRLADGHPLLKTTDHLPLSQAAAAAGIPPEDLLRRAADGRIGLFCRLAGEHGYVAPEYVFEPDDPELGTVVVPSRTSMPLEARAHRAWGIHRIPKEDARAVAELFVTANQASERIVCFELMDTPGQPLMFVPDRSLQVGIEHLQVSAVEVETLRRSMAAAIQPAALEAARRTYETSAREVEKTARAKTPLLDALEAYCSTHLPRSIRSEGEIGRVKAGIALLAEFEGNLPIGEFDPDRLRHFRDSHLSRMPAHENRVRSKYGTTSMAESVQAISGSDWPLMSADERDQRMQWIGRMFRWLHEQKWISDDPSTGLRGESVMTKAERTRKEAAHKPREEFTPQELTQIFSAPHFRTGRGEQSKEGTFRTFQPFHYWLPLLGLFTGARIGELCQLHLSDVGQEQNVWFININEETADKSLKNRWSERRVPLHPKLVELGFPEWCRRLEQAGYRRVFPELSWDPEKRYAKEPIRRMQQYFASLGMPRDGSKVFHSFRHVVNNVLTKRTQMPDIMRKRLMGHEPGGGVNERHYLSDPTPSELFEFVAALNPQLPEIAAFNQELGLLAVEHALRRKNKGRGGSESLGDASDAVAGRS